MHRVERWADEWEMSVGAKKCGVMVFGDSTETLRSRSWTLQGQQVPVVESYTYLGIEIHHDMDLAKSAQAITTRTRKALFSLRPALTNSAIPVAVKVMILKSLVLPIATLGGELLGMNKARAKHSQSLIDKGLLWILRGERAGRGNMGMAVMRLELDIAPLHALLCARRTRAWCKFRTLSTWIACLMKEPFKSRKNTWVSGTSSYLKRFLKDMADGPSLSPKASARRVASLVWDSEVEKDGAKGLEHYLNSCFRHSREFIGLALPHTDLCKGIVWLIRMRLLAVWTGPRAAKARLVDPRWSSMCPSCGEECQEDLTHILLECSSAAAERARHIQPLEEWFAGFNSALHREDIATLILGGQVGGVDLSQQWLGEATHTDWRDRAPFLMVAEFLQSVMPRRMGRLWGDRSLQALPRGLGFLLPQGHRVPDHIVEVVITPTPDRMSQRPSG